MIEKTLSDYIKRITQDEAETNQRVAVNRNVWNGPTLAKQDVYNVYPESKSIDSDEKINSYSQH
jgi:hypothetical protein